MDSIHDQLDKDNYDIEPSTLLGNMFRSSSRKSLSTNSSTPEIRIHQIENRVARLEKQTNQPNFNGTLFGMFAVGCIFDYLSKR